MPPLVVVAGPNASGKSALAIDLALRFDGEIVSADSRQTYRGLDIGSAKVTRSERALVPHHLLDVAEIDEDFSLGLYQHLAFQAISDIHSRGRLPLLVGGTPLYVRAMVENYVIPNVPPDPALRRELESKPAAELAAILKEIDPVSASTIDSRNARRLIRAIEVSRLSGRPFSDQRLVAPARYRVLSLGIARSRSDLYARIDRRVDERLMGMIEEISGLLARGVSPARLYRLGLEYRFITMFLAGEIATLEDSVRQLKTAIHAFTRRQIGWFKKDAQMIWLDGASDYHRAAWEPVKLFLEHPA